MLRQKFVSRAATCAVALLSASVLTPLPAQAADDTRPAASGAVPQHDPMMRVSEQGPVASLYGDPTPTFNQWVRGYTMAAHTRTMFRQATSNLQTGIRRAQERFQRSHDFTDALAADKKAYADYTATRDRAVEALNENARYHETIRLRDEIGARLAVRRADSHAPKDELLAMATLKMQYASDARVIEAQALDANPSMKAARDKMVAAGQKVVEMRSTFDDALHDNSEIAQLRKNVEDSRLAMVTAEAFANAAAAATYSAIDYGYYVHRNDQGFYQPYGPANSIAAGGSYYSPYWGR